MSAPLPVEWSGTDVAPASRRIDDVRIRRLREADLAACRRFFDSLTWNDVRTRFASPKFVTEYFLPRRIAAGEDAAFAGFDDAGLILGVANLYFLSAASAEIAIVIRSDRQRRGVGRALVEHAIREAQGHGRLEAIGLIQTANRPALLFAQALGFRAIGWDSTSFEVMRLVS